MTTRSEYLLAAGDFAKAAGDYFSPVTTATTPSKTTSRETARQASAEVLLARAEVALPKSAAFNTAVDAQLNDATLSDGERRDTDMQLLSKMLTDLHIGKDLLDATDSEMGSRDVAAQSIRSAATDKDALHAIAGITAVGAAGVQHEVRAVMAVPDLPTAKAKLAEVIEDTFDVISKRSVKISKDIVSSAIDLGFSEIAQGAGDIVKTAANWLGKTENLNRLVEMARKFLAKAYEAALKYIGDGGLDVAKNKVVGWLKELVDNRDTKINEWMAKLYMVEATQAAVLNKAHESTSDLNKHVGAINGVETLNGHFKQYVDIVDKIMKVTPMLKTAVVALHQPQAIAGLAVFYVLAFAMVVLTGGAFLDAPQLKVLRNIRGVDDLVTANLT